MSYSSIIKRKCKGENCKKYPILGMSGYCYSCCPEEIKIKFADKKKVAQRKANERTKIRSLNNLLVNKDLVDSKKELKEWFAYHMANSERKCENCGADLSHYNDKLWHGSQHHIIEKSLVNGCPSVAAVLDNHAVLGFYCCHSQAGTSNFNLSKMAVFPLLKERFAKFEHLIAQDERKKIPNIFL